tara:strand:- start:9454 stop:10104 length:651 start_codon:yes stop_codon:yes gene_type:complete
MLNRTSILIQPNNISYFNDVYKLQKNYQEKLISGISTKQVIWIGEHHLCYTIGRGANNENILPLVNNDSFQVFKLDRGGDVTCHMPGQIVVYLILNLNNYKKDLNWYLRKIEDLIINVLAEFQIKASRKTGFTGVWFNNRKIASVGIGCKRWITIHGFSLNVSCNLKDFNRIIPCGIKDCSMVNVSDLNSEIKIEDVKMIVKKFVQEEFNIDFVSE